MKNVRILAALLAGFFFWAGAAQAQYSKVQTPWYQQGKISGGISVSNSSSSTVLPTAGLTAWICNTGSTDAYLAFGVSGVTATVNGSSWLKAGLCGNYDLQPFTTKLTYVAAITASSTTTLTVETGSGSGPLQTGSGGGGGGGAVTLASGAVASGAYSSGSIASGAYASGSIGSGAMVDLGAIADAAATAGSTGTVSAKLRLMTTQLNTLNSTLGSPAQAGGAVQAQPTPVTSGGLTNYFVQPAASDNHANIKNGAGQVYKIDTFGIASVPNYVRLYNAGTGFNGCNSATNLVWQGVIPASTSGAGLSSSWDLGMAFSTGISICVTSGYATNDTTAATASALMVSIGYK